jgi:hypothetical protein
VVVAGVTVTEVTPDARGVPPHVPEYHSHVAPVPREPPTSVRSTEVPLQIVVCVAVIEVGATEPVFTVIVTCAHAVVLHVPSALTKYVVVAAGVTFNVVVPLPIRVPPQLSEYQYQLAPDPSDPPDIVSVTFVPLHILLTLGVIDVGAVDSVLTKTDCWAETGLAQPPVIVYMILQLPPEMPVTTPVEGSTVAMPVLLLLHAPVPPPRTTVLAVYVVVVFIQIGLVPETEAILALGVIVIFC